MRCTWLAALLALSSCASGRNPGSDGGGDGSVSVVDAASSVDAPRSRVDADVPDAATGSPDAASIAPRLNEFVINHTGDDVSEFIEIHAEPATDHSSLTVLVVEGGAGGGQAGVVDRTYQVGETDADGLWATAFFTDELENDNLTLLLVSSYTGVGTPDLDTDNDGVLDTEPWAELLDSVAIQDLEDAGVHYGDVVLMPGYDGVAFEVGGASRVPDGEDTGDALDWTRNDFDGEGLPCCAGGGGEAGEALNTPGAPNQAVAP